MLYPQLAQQTEVTSLESFINDDRWVMEQKLDGHRLLLMSPGANMAPTPITRNGSIYTRRLPKEVMDFRFPEGDWAIDGEFVDGKFWAFDLPLAPLPNWSTTWLTQRRIALETLFDTIPHPFCLVPQAKTRVEKIALAGTALTSNFEGLVLKKGDSTYRSGGRTPEWLKVKFVATADVVVTGVRTDGKDSVDYAIYDAENHGLKPIGRASLIGKEKKGAIAVGDVLEVRYLYVGADGRLYQPTILRKRDDKRWDECTGDQLKYANKDVLATL